AGGRESRVQTFLEDMPYDSYRTQTDEEGRLVVDRIKSFPGLNLRTQLTYDDASDRVRQAQELQNNQIRVTRFSEPERRQADGTTLLPVRSIPAWGLSSTQTFLLGEPLGRPLSTYYENGDHVE